MAIHIHSKKKVNSVYTVKIFGLARVVLKLIFQVSVGAKELLWQHTKTFSTCSYKIADCLKMVARAVKIVIGGS